MDNFHYNAWCPDKSFSISVGSDPKLTKQLVINVSFNEEAIVTVELYVHKLHMIFYILKFCNQSSHLSKKMLHTVITSEVAPRPGTVSSSGWLIIWSKSKLCVIPTFNKSQYNIFITCPSFNNLPKAMDGVSWHPYQSIRQNILALPGSPLQLSILVTALDY